jgi:hypothetical protein
MFHRRLSGKPTEDFSSISWMWAKVTALSLSHPKERPFFSTMAKGADATYQSDT